MFARTTSRDNLYDINLWLFFRCISNTLKNKLKLLINDQDMNFGEFSSCIRHHMDKPNFCFCMHGRAFKADAVAVMTRIDLMHTPLAHHQWYRLIARTRNATLLSSYAFLMTKDSKRKPPHGRQRCLRHHSGWLNQMRAMHRPAAAPCASQTSSSSATQPLLIVRGNSPDEPRRRHLPEGSWKKSASLADT